MAMIHACVEQIRHKNVTVQERGRKAKFVNPSKSIFLKIRVDGCLIANETAADWIVTKRGYGSVIIELKGKDVRKACDQAFATLDHHLCAEWLEQRKAILIVCSRFPAFDSKIARAEEMARKRGLRLKFVCSESSCAMESLFAADA